MLISYKGVNEIPYEYFLFNSAHSIIAFWVSNAVDTFSSDKLIERHIEKIINIFGYNSKEELISKSVYDLLPPNVHEKQRILGSKRVAGETVPATYQTEGLKNTGETFPIQVHATRIDFTEGPRILAFIEDISEKAEAEKALKESGRLDRIKNIDIDSVELNTMIVFGEKQDTYPYISVVYKCFNKKGEHMKKDFHHAIIPSFCPF